MRPLSFLDKFKGDAFRERREIRAIERSLAPPFLRKDTVGEAMNIGLCDALSSLKRKELRSSVYGPELLKDPTVADDVDVSLGRKKTGEEFETDHVETSKCLILFSKKDRAKRIRRERRAAKAI